MCVRCAHYSRGYGSVFGDRAVKYICGCGGCGYGILELSGNLRIILGFLLRINSILLPVYLELVSIS